MYITYSFDAYVSPVSSLKHVDGYDLQRVCGVPVVHQDAELEVVMRITSDTLGGQPHTRAGGVIMVSLHAGLTLTVTHLFGKGNATR